MTEINTTQEQFDIYIEGHRRLAAAMGMTDPGAADQAAARRLLVTLPDGTRKAWRDTTADDWRAIDDYLQRHVQATQNLARLTRLECETVRPDLAAQIDWDEDQL